MFTIVLIIQLLVILAMIAAVLLQRSEGGALGMGGGGGGSGGGLMSNRGAGSALTRATGVLAGMFFICSITLAVLARSQIDTGLDYDGDAAVVEGAVLPDDGASSLPEGGLSIVPAEETTSQAQDDAVEIPAAASDDENRPQIPE